MTSELLETWSTADGITATRRGRPSRPIGNPPPPPAQSTKMRLYRSGVTGTIASTPVTPPVYSGTVNPGDLAGATPGDQLAYAIPAGAIYVDPVSGTAGGAGTLASPVQTIAQANTKVAAGGTIVVGTAATTYTIHEGTSIPANGTGYSVNNVYANVSLTKANTTLQPYPGATVIFDGTSVQTGWTQAGSVWSKPLAITLDRSATDTYGKLDNDARGIGWLWVRSQQWHDLVVAAGSTEQQAKMYPLASWPEQVWIDGVRQTQVASLAAVVPGTFYVAGTATGTNNMLWASTTYYLGSDPTGKEVRVADMCTAIGTAADSCTIRGVKVRRYAGAINQGGAVKSRSTNTTFENVVVEDCMVCFELFGSDGATHRQCEAWRGGVLGFKTSGSYNITYDRCVAEQCNYARYNWAPVSGGIKATTARNVLILNCRLRNNWSKGWWADVSCYGIDIVNTDFSGNEQFGLVSEISAKTRVVNCLLSHMGKDGYLWHDANDSELWHCTFKDNGKQRNQLYDSANPRSVKIYEDNRRIQDDTAYPSTGSTGGTYQSYGRDGRQNLTQNTIDLNNFVIQKIQIYNNIFDQGNQQFAYYVIEDLQKSQGNSRPLSAYGLLADGNMFCRPSTSNPSWAFLAPGAGTAQEVVTTLARWQAVSGQEAHSVEIVGASPTDVDGYLSLANRTKYGPGGSNAVTTKPLPADLAALVGVSPGSYAPGVIPIPTTDTATYTAALRSGTQSNPVHLAVVGDSIEFGAAQYGSTPPKYLNSWPGKMRAALNSNYGTAGSGVVLMNQDLWPITTGAAGNTGWEPRMVVTGTVTEPTLGFHGHGAFTVPDGGTTPSTYIEITVTCTEFWLYLVAGSAGVVRFTVDGQASQTGSNLAAGGAATNIVRQAGTSSQHVALRIPAGSLGSHTLRFWGDGGAVTAWAWEGRTYGGSISIDNESISGKSLGTFLSSTAGRDGLAFIDTLKPDVTMICLGPNDYNGGVPTATAVANLNSVITRVKANGSIPVGFFPPQSNNSVIYPGSPAPTYTQYVTAFASAYAAAGVDFCNLQKLWAPTLTNEQAIFDAGNALGKYADGAIHPNDSGAADIAAAVRTFLGL